MQPFVIIITALLLNICSSISTPLMSRQPSRIDEACGQSLGDCAAPLTCIPVSPNCTKWVSRWSEGCPGTCQDIDISKQQIYTICGGWGYYDDCNERIERCVTDPRNGGCGPSCDAMGICWPFKEVCGGETGLNCPQGKACFEDNKTKDSEQGGICLPLRFGSDYYEKTELEQVFRTDQDGWQGERR